MARVLDGAIAELAPKTLGLLTNTQLDRLGLSRQQRRTLVARGMLAPVGPGVVRHSAHPRSWEQRALAAVLAAGRGAVASHMTAATLWGFDGMDKGPVEVTVPRARNPRSVVEATVHRVDLGAADLDPQPRLIPRTSASRTFVDIAPALSPQRLEEVLDGAERDGSLWRPRLRWQIDQLRSGDGRANRPGLAAVEALLDRTEGRPLGDSWLEQETIRILSAAGLPRPRVQVRRRHGGGSARVDLFWDAARLVVEVSGHATHATRRQRQRGHERSARLGLAGWRYLEFTYEDVVERPDHVVDIVRAYLIPSLG